MKTIKRYALITLILILVISFTGIKLPAGGHSCDVIAEQTCSWFCFRGDTRRTGATHNDCGPMSSNLTFLWSFETINQIVSSPAIAESRVIFGSDDGYVHCLEQSTRNQLWETHIDADIHSSPAYSMGNIYVGSENGRMYCLDLDTGKIEWFYETEAPIHSSPVVYNQRLYFGSYDYFVYCISPISGELIWQFETGGEVFSSPAVYEERVYIGSDDENLYCLDFKSGELLWQFGTSKEISATPVYIDGRVVFASDSVYCLSASTGDIFWEFPVGPYGVSSCAFARSTVTMCRWDGMLFNFNLHSGNLNWSHKINGFSKAPSVCAERIYLATDEGWFSAVGIHDGETIWETNLGEQIAGNPAISDGLVVVTSTDGKVYCYGDEIARDCVSLNVEVVDFGTTTSKGTGEVEVSIRNCGTNDVELEYEIEGKWFGVRRFPAGPIEVRHRKHFYVYLKSQSIGFDGVYNGSITLTWAGQEKVLPVRVFVDNQRHLGGGCQWWSHQGNLSGAGNAFEGCFPDRKRLSNHWHVEFSDVPVSQPVVTKDRIVVARKYGSIDCVDFGLGNNLWSYNCDGKMDVTPSIYDDRVYWATLDGHLGCLSLEDGSLLWNTNLDDYATSDLRAWRDRVFFANQYGEIVSVDSATGRVDERFQADGIITGTPAVQSAKVYFGTDTGTLYCISAYDLSRPIWTVHCTAPITTAVSVNDGMCCFGLSNGVCMNVGSRSGSILWEARLGTYIEGDIAVTDDGVYCATRSNVLFALSSRDGEVIWRTDPWDSIVSGPIATSDRIVMSADNRLFTISRTDGSVIWVGDYTREIRNLSVAVSRIFACCQDRNLYCVGNMPFVTFSPQMINFGTLSKASLREQSVKVTNNGDSKVIVRVVSNAEWFTISDKTIPLDPGSTSSFKLSTIPYKVNDLGMHTGTITAYWGDETYHLKVWAYVQRDVMPRAWTSFGGDQANSGINRESRLTVSKLEQQWSYVTNAPILSSPLLDKGGVYFGSNDTDIRCLDSQLGVLLWSFNTGADVVSTSALANDMLFAGSEDGHLYCLDDSTGELLWDYYAGGLVSSVTTHSPSSKLTYVYFSSSHGGAYCLSVLDGEMSMRWHVDLGFSATSPPAIDGANIIFTGLDGSVSCLSVTDGKTWWSMDIGMTASPPLVADGKVYVEGLSGKVYCINIDDGEIEWTNNSVTGITCPLKVDYDIIACGINGWIVSMDAYTGENNWTFDVGKPIYSSPVTDGSVVIVTDMGGTIRILDSYGGKELWHHKLRLPIISSPALWEGRIYVGGCDRKMYCFGE